MQEDMTLLVNWLEKAPITKNEFRTALKYETIDLPQMDMVYMPMNLIAIGEDMATQNDINKAFE